MNCKTEGFGNCHYPQQETDRKIIVITSKVRKIWLFLPQNNYENRSEDYMKYIVASKIILLTSVIPFGLPYSRKQQRFLVVMLATSNPTSYTSPRRVGREAQNCGQCRRQCSVSSLAAPQIHIGLKSSKLCLNFCSFTGLNLTQSIVSILKPDISQILQVFIGLTI